VIAAKRELGRLDGLAGDGDLGATMENGFQAVRQQIQVEGRTMTIATQLRTMGETLLTEAPSTMGTLLGSAMVDAAIALGDPESATVETLATMLEAVADGVQSLGKCAIGQRSVFDALAPSAAAARAAADRQVDIEDMLDEACLAADAGARGTSDLQPAIGRARWTASSAAGVVDGGAQAWATWLEGFARGLKASEP
jgi:phosphoenolpyruvate---glycerone phosphotransferase subunit DhaL